MNGNHGNNQLNKDITKTEILSQDLNNIKTDRNLSLRKANMEREIESHRFRPRPRIFKSKLEIDVKQLGRIEYDYKSIKYLKLKNLEKFLDNKTNINEFKYGLYLCREFFKQEDIDPDDLLNSNIHLKLLNIVRNTKDEVILYESLWALSGFAKNTDSKYCLIRPFYFEDELINFYLSLLEIDNSDLKIMAMDLICSITGCFNYARDKILNSKIYNIIKDYYVKCRNQMISSNFNSNLNQEDNMVLEIFRKCVLFYYNCVKVRCELNQDFMFEIIEILCDALRLNYQDKDILDSSMLGIFSITYFDPIIFLQKITEQRIVSIFNKIHYQDVDSMLQYYMIVIMGNILVGNIETFDLMFDDGVYEWILMVIGLGKKTKQIKHAVWVLSNLVAKYKKYKLIFNDKKGLSLAYDILTDKDCDFEILSKIVKLIERLAMNLDFEIVMSLLENGFLKLAKFALAKHIDILEIDTILQAITNVLFFGKEKSERAKIINAFDIFGENLINCIGDYETHAQESISKMAKQITDYYNNVHDDLDMVFI